MSWAEKTIGDLVELQRGHDLPDSVRKPGTVPVIGSAGLTGYHNVAKSKGPGVTLGRSGASIGKVTYVPQDFWPHNACLYVKNFKGNDPRFVAYLLRTVPLAQLNSGAAQPSLNRNFVYGVRIKFPEPTDQMRVVDILDKYDDLIENNKRRIELLEESARQLYKEWFVRFRFPGHEHVKVIDGVPKGWEKTVLGAVSITNALSHKAKELPEEVNYIDISAVSTGRIETKNKMSAEDAPGRARRIAQHGDVIWSNVRPNLKAYALVLHPDEIDVFSTGFTTISGTRIPYSFLYNFTTTDNFVKHLVNHTTGSSYPAVRPPDFEKAELLLPPQTLLEQFHAICEPSYELAFILGGQTKQLAEARDLLLPKLMSGEIAV